MSIPTKVRFRGATYVLAGFQEEYDQLDAQGKKVLEGLFQVMHIQEKVMAALQQAKKLQNMPEGGDPSKTMWRKHPASSIDTKQPSAGESVNAPLYPTEIPTQHRASASEFLRFNGDLYRAVGATHPNVDTDGTPISDLKPKDKKEQSVVQESLDESRDMYFEQKGGDKKRPKEKGINPDYGDSHPGFGSGGPGDSGDGGGGDGGGGGNGGGGNGGG